MSRGHFSASIKTGCGPPCRHIGAEAPGNGAEKGFRRGPGVATSLSIIALQKSFLTTERRRWRWRIPDGTHPSIHPFGHSSRSRRPCGFHGTSLASLRLMDLCPNLQMEHSNLMSQLAEWCGLVRWHLAKPSAAEQMFGNQFAPSDGGAELYQRWQMGSRFPFYIFWPITGPVLSIGPKGGSKIASTLHCSTLQDTVHSPFSRAKGAPGNDRPLCARRKRCSGKFCNWFFFTFN